MFNYQQILEDMTPAAIRAHARRQMGRTVPPFWVITLVSMVLTTLVPDAVKSFCPVTMANGQLNALGLFLSILMTLFMWVMEFGYTWWALDSADGEQGENAPGIHTLFNGFSMVSSVLMLEISVAARKVLWSTVIAVPAVLLTVTLLLPATGDVGAVVSSVVMVAVVWGVYYIVSLRYVLARYLMIDQGDGRRSSGRAIRDSIGLMRGQKMAFFKLQLSFLGWYLLIVLLMILGIGLVSLVGWLDLSSVFAHVQGGNIAVAIGTVQSAPAVSLAMALLPLPVDLFLTPYTAVAAARFYRLRTQLAQCPPPVYEPEEHSYTGPEE